ncbi:hypothetical protein [Rubellimicrobium sp. CFH 75288]|uniref:hypothetical protein n=1 Tax=Rubellimicrobium sp. CFH 75288 TaxID=2697034 RepID=UPI0014135A7F|nr:hypothetical protein [Rubellimicrobium sp. CFH 75288]NAZ35457.1 hypothetical protein [Rubellimicrobium sp. CFH 75288]
MAQNALLIIDDLGVRQDLAGALREAGLAVEAASDRPEAEGLARRGGLSLLLASECFGGRSVQTLVLLAEWCSPLVATVLLCDRPDRMQPELFDLLPSLQAVLPRSLPAAEVARLARLAAAPSESEPARLLRRWREAGGPAAAEETPPPLLLRQPVALRPSPDPDLPLPLRVRAAGSRRAGPSDDPVRLPSFLTRRAGPAGSGGNAAPSGPCPPAASPPPVPSPAEDGPAGRARRLRLGLSGAAAAVPGPRPAVPRRLHLG